MEVGGKPESQSAFPAVLYRRFCEKCEKFAMVKVKSFQLDFYLSYIPLISVDTGSSLRASETCGCVCVCLR